MAKEVDRTHRDKAPREPKALPTSEFLSPGSASCCISCVTGLLSGQVADRAPPWSRLESPLSHMGHATWDDVQMEGITKAKYICEYLQGDGLNLLPLVPAAL